MRRALPIVSAVIPVLSERKKTGIGGGSAVISTRSPFHSPVITSADQHILSVSSQALKLYQ